MSSEQAAARPPARSSAELLDQAIATAQTIADRISSAREEIKRVDAEILSADLSSDAFENLLLERARAEAMIARLAPDAKRADADIEAAASAHRAALLDGKRAKYSELEQAARKLKEEIMDRARATADECLRQIEQLRALDEEANDLSIDIDRSAGKAINMMRPTTAFGSFIGFAVHGLHQSLMVLSVAIANADGRDRPVSAPTSLTRPMVPGHVRRGL